MATLRRLLRQASLAFDGSDPDRIDPMDEILAELDQHGPAPEHIAEWRGQLEEQADEKRAEMRRGLGLG